MKKETKQVSNIKSKSISNQKTKKETTLTDDFHKLMNTLSKKKDDSIKDLEELKNKILLDINHRLDNLYWKKNFKGEVKSNKKEFKKLRLGVWAKLVRAKLWTTIKVFIAMPFIYIMIVPGLFLHICVEIYHQVCFRLYGIPLVNPREYFVFDRALLPQLNWLEKFNCFYCSYYNCLVSYLQEIVGRTERFWCPIKHAKRMENVHKHYENFVDYSDAKNLRKEWEKLREFEEFKKCSK